MPWSSSLIRPTDAEVFGGVREIKGSRKVAGGVRAAGTSGEWGTDRVVVIGVAVVVVVSVEVDVD